MSEERECPACGAELPPDAPQELCPKCLMKMGLPTGVEIDKPGTEATDSDAAPQSTPGAFSPPEPAELAEQFPQLEILQLLGQGGMGAVYKATQSALDRPVALKILPPQVGQDPAFAERFTREARAMARLNHPHIVSVYDFGKTAEGLYYFVMEFVDGTDLRHVIRSGEISPKEALAIVPQICEALQYAHEEGIVHRDIKPENVLLDKKGRVKIADFGLAKLLDRPATPYTLTDPAQRMGTPHYMAPEQVEHPHDVDHRADIYSLGVVFYEMLTGELPLGRFPPPSRKVQVDVRLDEVVLKTLEKEPERRYQQASQVKTDVETISSSPDLPKDVEAIRHRVWIPAVGLLTAGIINCIVIVGALSVGGRAVAVVPAVYSVALLLGGWHLMQLRSLALAAIGSALAILPLGPAALIGLPMGIWAVILLSKQEVRAAFGQRRSDVSVPPKVRKFAVSAVDQVKAAVDREKAEFRKLRREKHTDAENPESQDPEAATAAKGMTMAIASCVLGLLSILFVSLNADFPIRFAFGFASLAIAIFTGALAIKSVKSYREQLLQTSLAAAGIFFGAVSAIALLGDMPW